MRMIRLLGAAAVAMFGAGTAGCGEIAERGGSAGSATGGGSGGAAGGGGDSTDAATSGGYECPPTTECDAGTVLEDTCRGTFCPVYYGTCYPPAPPPGMDEFSCDGLLNCAVGQVCKIAEPFGDGCYDHDCVPIPAACAADPSCECLASNVSGGSNQCTLDGDGNATIRGPY
jgi:hypothetical protein